MVQINDTVAKVTEQINERSRGPRQDYLDLMARSGDLRPQRGQLSCGNLAHGFAACGDDDKDSIRLMEASNIGIVTAFNDMLSAHQPYAEYPEKIKSAVRAVGSTAQVAGGVPAMCDGVTQGQIGMELSLFSRDNIAQSTGIALSHHMFDGIVCLGICDKIVPGLIMGVLRFGHLPALFIPAGPMPSGLPNAEKARVRQLFAEGKVGREELLAAESASYHSAGTCTFYGTANTNQMVMEAMGLQLPGGSFVNPDTPLREALTRESSELITRITAQGRDPRPLASVIDARSFVNAIVALLASGGSTNHTIHLVAMARAAGLIINWDDFAQLSAVVPLLARVYPNGQADINHFHAAGGTGFLFRELLDAGLMHGTANTVWGENFQAYTQEPYLVDGQLTWRPAATTSLDPDVLGTMAKPFASEGGLRLLKGNLGRAVIKVSAVKPEHRKVTAPAVVIDSQEALAEKFANGDLERDCVVVVRFQGPRANGMPELHKLTPLLGSLLDKGFAVALVTDGRMSGASGKVPAAIHVTPEAAMGGALARLQDGDMLTLDAVTGTLQCDDAQFLDRPLVTAPRNSEAGVGRELFGLFREVVTTPEAGATVIFREEA
ncbi:phosphogluconate dehydratase [Congregibacter litoralis]|uniref:Phosphogluconate dehydratase n=1 Tax=Congregibacter litoralis KT71 TaxID=314285 RepID=A4AD77_9GAMM|nr:phosphogluconate dehydratase [Congregibacter litoralis]EAQ96001.1 6-phosphogluconate dehydratase [Congregibacter litoralis KT71]